MNLFNKIAVLGLILISNEVSLGNEKTTIPPEPQEIMRIDKFQEDRCQKFLPHSFWRQSREDLLFILKDAVIDTQLERTVVNSPFKLGMGYKAKSEQLVLAWMVFHKVEFFTKVYDEMAQRVQKTEMPSMEEFLVSVTDEGDSESSSSESGEEPINDLLFGNNLISWLVCDIRPHHALLKIKPSKFRRVLAEHEMPTYKIETETEETLKKYGIPIPE